MALLLVRSHRPAPSTAPQHKTVSTHIRIRLHAYKFRHFLCARTGNEEPHSGSDALTKSPWDWQDWTTRAWSVRLKSPD
jgi:hypothetical protein